ncbi:uncharacterized protein CLUP02_08022 [Colletotrichum lupini]|uniref:Uncharacterized protein n=1 Tax=Colletotrichum lupini TaxID=145971 RepID=A0A9Q8SS39_9PEZI|nr:uncharacterized protein CLUP02_08022 [Colletotrichum lupini]UQC82534.1 hypothetical protein CLUP02_08022 [Colletotrichum lupini]
MRTLAYYLYVIYFRIKRLLFRRSKIGDFTKINAYNN